MWQFPSPTYIDRVRKSDDIMPQHGRWNGPTLVDLVGSTMSELGGWILGALRRLDAMKRNERRFQKRPAPQNLSSWWEIQIRPPTEHLERYCRYWWFFSGRICPGAPRLLILQIAMMISCVPSGLICILVRHSRASWNIYDDQEGRLIDEAHCEQWKARFLSAVRLEVEFFDNGYA